MNHTTLDKEKMLAALLDREWLLNDDLKTCSCLACNARFPRKTNLFDRYHNKGCAYKAAITTIIHL